MTEAKPEKATPEKTEKPAELETAEMDTSQPDQPETTEIDTSKLVAPNEDASDEPTPIFDEVVESIETAKHSDKTDVPAALKRETQDGAGEEDPGPSDFESFATEGVEKED